MSASLGPSSLALLAVTPFFSLPAFCDMVPPGSESKAAEAKPRTTRKRGAEVGAEPLVAEADAELLAPVFGQRGRPINHPGRLQAILAADGDQFEKTG